MIFRFSFFLIVLVAFQATAQIDTLEVKDLSHQWVGIEENGGFDFVNSSTQLVTFTPPKLSEGEHLLIKSDAPFAVWVDEQLFFTGSPGEFELTTKAYDDQSQIQIYCESGVENQIRARVVRFEESPYKEGKPISRENKDSYVMIFFLLLVVFAIYKWLFPNTFQMVTRQAFARSTDRMSQNTATVEYFYGLLVLSLLVSACLIFNDHPAELFGKANGFTPLVNWLMTSLVVAMFFIVKYVTTYFLGFLHGFRELASLHLSEYVKKSFWGFFVALILTILLFINPESRFLSEWVIIWLIIHAILFIIWFMVKLDNSYPHKKLMIFSYLCTTEIVPVILIVNWLLNR